MTTPAEPPRRRASDFVTMSEKPKSDLEKHITTVVVMVILGFITYVGTSVSDFSRFQAEQQITIANISEKLIDVKTEIRDAIRTNYTKEDAARDILTVTQSISGLKARVDHLETEVDGMLRDHRMIIGKKAAVGEKHD